MADPSEPKSSKMEKSASTIGRQKFLRLEVGRQHRLLANLARNALATEDLNGFLKRYRQMMRWTGLDRYQPPAWLAPIEMLQGFWAFHALLGGEEAEQAPQPPPTNRLWQPRFQVEVVLDRIRGPYNFGSVLRLVDNFGFAGVLHNCPWISLDHPRLQKSARGCQHWIPVRYEPDLLEALAESEAPLIALETGEDALSIDDWKPLTHCRLLLGNEAGGIAGALLSLCRDKLRIPQYGFKHSMNVHHALAIAGYKIASSARTHLPGPADFC